ncbi:MAG TPA: hypothetical protein VHZ52_07400 [Acidobacteriaceae bacterium]|jgi:hypothetical protein|nr:hypothetical protein [Acidobacteriaceae bacterium]
MPITINTPFLSRSETAPAGSKQALKEKWMLVCKRRLCASLGNARTAELMIEAALLWAPLDPRNSHFSDPRLIENFYPQLDADGGKLRKLLEEASLAQTGFARQTVQNRLGFAVAMLAPVINGIALELDWILKEQEPDDALESF